MWRVDSLEKTLMLGGIGGRRRRGGQRMRWLGWRQWLDGCESEWTPGVGDGQGGLDGQGGAAIHGIAKSWTWLSDWTELIDAKTKSQDSLLVQWLRMRLLTGDTGSLPGPGRVHVPVWYNCWACAAQWEEPPHPEACTHCNEEEPQLATTRESLDNATKIQCSPKISN